MGGPAKSMAILGRTLLLISACLCLGWADSWVALKQAAATVSSVSAEFTQQKHMPILARPLESSGVFMYRAPDCLRWEYRHPVRSILLTHEGRTRRFFQSGSELVEDAGVNLQAMQMVVREITGWLHGRFDENSAFSAKLTPDRKIVLTPKETSFARLIRRIDIVLAERPGVIESVTIHESEDSFTRIDFSNVQLNLPMDGAVFQNGS